MGQAGVFGLGDGLPRLRRGLRVTHLGDERLVLDPVSGVVHTVRGSAVRALDDVVWGRPVLDQEVIAALAGVGIVDVVGATRREALLLAGAATALIASAALPSALAAASTAGSSFQGDDGVLNTYSMADGSILYSLTHSSNSSSTVTRNLILGGSAKKVELLLVGGGGAGGSGDLLGASATVFGGGGGGGELLFVTLDSVNPSTNFELVVAGRAASGKGQDTIVSYSPSGTEVGRAEGGGVGGGFLAPGGNGGSGGGGSSVSTYDRGSSNAGGANSYGSDGAVGASGTSGGGGGAGATSATTGNSTTGGDGGSARSLSDFFSLTVAVGESAVSGQLALGAGGGGAGDSVAGDGGTGAGNGATTAAIASSGEFGSGGGGGGGVSVKDDAGAQPGWGATGAIWVRVSNPV